MTEKTLNQTVLEMFCDTDNEMRPMLNKPFSHKNMVYGTDAYFLAVINKDNVDKTYPEDSGMGEKCLKILPSININFTINVSNLRSKIESVPKVDGFDIIREDIECDACDGECEVEFEFEHNLQTYTTTADCPICDGEGLIYKSINKPNGTKVINPKAYCVIGNTLFHLIKISKLITAAEVLRLPEISLISTLGTNANATLFKIGDLNILLCNCSPSGSDLIGFTIDIN